MSTRPLYSTHKNRILTIKPHNKHQSYGWHAMFDVRLIKNKERLQGIRLQSIFQVEGI